MLTNDSEQTQIVDQLREQNEKLLAQLFSALAHYPITVSPALGENIRSSFLQAVNSYRDAILERAEKAAHEKQNIFRTATPDERGAWLAELMQQVAQDNKLWEDCYLKSNILSLLNIDLAQEEKGPAAAIQRTLADYCYQIHNALIISIQIHYHRYVDYHAVALTDFISACQRSKLALQESAARGRADSTSSDVTDLIQLTTAIVEVSEPDDFADQLVFSRQDEAFENKLTPHAQSKMDLKRDLLARLREFPAASAHEKSLLQIFERHRWVTDNQEQIGKAIASLDFATVNTYFPEEINFSKLHAKLLQLALEKLSAKSWEIGFAIVIHTIQESLHARKMARLPQALTTAADVNAFALKLKEALSEENFAEIKKDIESLIKEFLNIREIPILFLCVQNGTHASHAMEDFFLNQIKTDLNFKSYLMRYVEMLRKTIVNNIQERFRHSLEVHKGKLITFFENCNKGMMQQEDEGHLIQAQMKTVLSQIRKVLTRQIVGIPSEDGSSHTHVTLDQLIRVIDGVGNEGQDDQQRKINILAILERLFQHGANPAARNAQGQRADAPIDRKLRQLQNRGNIGRSDLQRLTPVIRTLKIFATHTLQQSELQAETQSAIKEYLAWLGAETSTEGAYEFHDPGTLFERITTVRQITKMLRRSYEAQNDKELFDLIKAEAAASDSPRQVGLWGGMGFGSRLYTLLDALVRAVDNGKIVLMREEDPSGKMAAMQLDMQNLRREVREMRGAEAKVDQQAQARIEQFRREMLQAQEANRQAAASMAEVARQREREARAEILEVQRNAAADHETAIGLEARIKALEASLLRQNHLSHTAPSLQEEGPIKAVSSGSTSAVSSRNSEEKLDVPPIVRIENAVPPASALPHNKKEIFQRPRSNSVPTTLFFSSSVKKEALLQQKQRSLSMQSLPSKVDNMRNFKRC